MIKAATRSVEPDRAKTSTRIFEIYTIIPLLACVYATIVSPLMIVGCSPNDTPCLLEPRPENKIFWPLLAAISVILALRNGSRLKFPPHIICLFAYLAFAGASVLWAFKPELSFVRYAQQAMIVISIILPAFLATRDADLMRGLFLCFAVAAVLNLLFVFGRPPIDYKFVTWGYPGYFSGKNYLGQFAAVALLLSIHEALHRGARRVFGIVVIVIAVALLVLSNSKTSIGLVTLAPFLAAGALFVRKTTRISPAILVLSFVVCYAVLATITGVSTNRLSYMLYGDSTFTGRSIIWDFAHVEIARRPLFGWGYQSFWLVGPDAPSVVDAPGWVKDMPNAHNGYLDTILEMGYVGLLLLVAFIAATLHAIGRMADRDFVRAWLILSLAFFIIITNGLESLWMRGFEMLWIVFLILAAEVGRNWRPLLSSRPVNSAAKRVRPHGPDLSRNVARPVAARSVPRPRFIQPDPAGPRS